MRRPTLAALAAVCCLALVTAACGSSGRDLRTPESNAVSPTRSTAATASTTTTTEISQFSLLTTAFPAGGEIPAEYSCAGPSPALAWQGVPPGTTELALAVTDPDASGFVHWLVTGISATSASIAKGQVPPGSTQFNNSAGKLGWLGPCPPPGPAHTYSFTLYALSAPADITPDTPPKDAVAQLARKATTSTVLTGTFKK